MRICVGVSVGVILFLFVVNFRLGATESPVALIIPMTEMTGMTTNSSIYVDGTPVPVQNDDDEDVKVMGQWHSQ